MEHYKLVNNNIKNNVVNISLMLKLLCVHKHLLLVLDTEFPVSLRSGHTETVGHRGST